MPVLLRRQLTAAEEAIDVAAIDQLLNDQKDQLEEAIRDEQARVARAAVDGRTARLTVTKRMREILDLLQQEGTAHAEAELAKLGWPDGREFAVAPIPPDPADELQPLLDRLSTRVRDTAIDLSLEDVARDAILRKLLEIPGARFAAAEVISGAFTLGLAQTFETHAHLIDQTGGGPGWQYSAILDAGTCDPCEEMDGRVFASWAAIMVVLPNGGPFPDCYGGGRCRCRPVPLPA